MSARILHHVLKVGCLVFDPGCRKEKKRKDYAFWRQLNEKPSVILGSPDPRLLQVQPYSQLQPVTALQKECRVCLTTYHGVLCSVQVISDQPAWKVCCTVSCLKAVHMERLQQTLPNSC